MAHMPIPPEFLEPKALRFAGPSAKGGWMQIVLSYWVYGEPWPDFSNQYEVMARAGITGGTTEKSFAVLTKCFEQLKERIVTERARKEQVRRNKVASMGLNRQLRHKKQGSNKQISDTPTNAGASSIFTGQGAVRTRSDNDRKHTMQSGVKAKPAVPGMIGDTNAGTNAMLSDTPRELESPGDDT